MKKGFFLSLTMLMVLSLHVHASTRVGNGGGVLVCKEQNGQTKVTLIDLYEAKARFKLNVPLSADTVEDQVDRALDRLDAVKAQMGHHVSGPVSYREMVERNIKNVQKALFFIPEDQKLQLVDDANYLVLPRNCEKQQLALYTQSKLYVDPLLFKQLDDLNKAAFFVHEGVYALQVMGNEIDTKLEEVNSDSVRKIVAYLFSDLELEQVVSREQKNLLHCTTLENNSHQSHSFYIFARKEKVEIEFTKIFNENMISRTHLLWDPKFDLNSSSDLSDRYVRGSGLPVSLMLPNSGDREDAIKVSVVFDKAKGESAEAIASNVKKIGVNAFIGFPWYQGEVDVQCRPVQFLSELE